MKLPYSIPMETIWHGAKSLAYRFGAECFGPSKGSSIECLNEQNCSSLCMNLRRSNVSKHIGFSQNHITKACSFACHPKFLQVCLQHSQQICNTLFCSWISAIEKSKDALDQLIQKLETSPDIRGKLLVHACTIRLFALTRSCAWIGLSSTSCYVTASSLRACGQFQTSIWKRRQWREFGNKTIIFHHPSIGFSPG